jgi:parallel beta-helix repeat protein
MNARRLTGLLSGLALATAGIVGAASPAAAATSFWVDAGSATCSNTGPGSSATPFCSISAAAAKAVAAGDTVTVAPGTYPEQVTVAGSGAAGMPITFTSSGPGVTVLGTRDLSSAVWTATSGGTWSTPYAPASAPRQVFVDGARLAAGSGPTTLTANQFAYDATAKVLYVNLGGDAPTAHTVLAGAQTYGFNVVGRTHVVIRGFTTAGQNNAGVRVNSSSDVVVDTMTSTDSGINGVLVEAASTGVTVTGTTVSRAASVGLKVSSSTGVQLSHDVVSGSGNHGISVVGSPGTVVEYTESSHNVVTAGSATAAGIDVNGTSPDAVIRGNIVHDNQDSGIQVYNGSDRALVVRNISYANGDHGLDTLASVGVRYLSNTVQGNRTDGISIEGLSTGAALRDNIAVDNGLPTGNPDLYVEQTSMTGLTADRDLFWNSAWVPAVRIGLTRYRTMADFTAGTGLEAAGIGADPHFVDAGSHDYRLSANSAAIDAADATASGFEPADQTGTAAADDPNVPDTGTGTPTYADLGALERAPRSGDLAENPPYAALVLSTNAGQVPPGVSVTADASGSSDADAHGIASYTFDFGDGTTVGPQPSGTATHTYVASGARVVTVTVTDTAGQADTAHQTVSLTDRTLVTYHVDRADPTCSDTGNGTTTPFCTISRAAAVAIAGDTVVVQPGDYPEQVTPAATGMSGAPITFHANGSGVRLLGTTDLSAPAVWTATATAAWRTPLTSASPVTQVFLGGTRLAKAASATTTTSGSFYYDAGNATLYVDAGGANPATTGAVLASTRTYGFKLWNAESVVVEGFTSWGANGVGVSIQDSKGVVVSGVTVQAASSYGISADRSSAIKVTGSTALQNGSIGIRMAATNDALITSNTSHDNGLHGISLQGSVNGTVSGNTTYANVFPAQRQAAGIDISLSSTGAVVERNTSYGNQDSGIEIYTGSDNATVRRNVAYDNGDHGLDCLGSVGDHVIGNTAVGNSAAGINLEGGCSNAVVGDNISVDNAVGSTRTIGDIRLDEASTPGSVVDWNLVNQTSGGPLYEWNSAPYTTVVAFNAASGQGAHDSDAAPGFIDLAARNLALTATSAAIDSANLGMSGAAGVDHDGTDPVDVVAVADSGSGSPAYADRGALEYHGGLATTPGPTAHVTASPATGNAPLTVTATATGSSAGGAAITSYTFTCGTGNTVGPQTSPTATCSYSAAGTFTLGVTVRDGNGFTSSATTTVTVDPPNLPPTAKLKATVSAHKAPATATLDASGSRDPEGRPLTYRYDCGNGTVVGPTPSTSATCRYTKAGKYTLSVTVTDDIGQTATFSTKINL